MTEQNPRPPSDDATAMPLHPQIDHTAQRVNTPRPRALTGWQARAPARSRNLTGVPNN